MDTTEIVIAALTVGLLLWDIRLYTDKVPDNSISQTLIRDSKKFPIIAFLFGLLVGHLYG